MDNREHDDRMWRVRRRVVAALLLCVGACLSAAHAQGPPNQPLADQAAVVVAGHARFSLLTPQLIRMEWAEDGKFEDRASLVFINRRLPVPAFQKREEGDWLILETGKVSVWYRQDAAELSQSNLRVTFDLNGNRMTWQPGMEDRGNLHGTIRTLDGVKGDTPLDPGLVSRDGWALVDDSDRPLFDASDWPWVVARPPGKRQDWYLFAYGHDYRAALKDFTRVAGPVPIPPRFAFGAWWSRYWAYTDEEFEDLVRQFRAHDVPLDVLVIDMDWHPTFGVKWWENKKDQSGHTLGWTGYTWNPNYFPNPEKFLSWAHAQGLRATLNMHPASGVQPHEAAYPAMARAMGIDPTTQKYVPFDIADKKFAVNYFDILHHPLEKQGIDFFWLDWQQEPQTSVAGLNPTWWLNYTHFTDMERRGKRGLILHRWGGLGNHRYQIAFTGDTISVWESLAFQPYFTATAANVGYGYWSHDIGGHMPGVVTPELYTRWVQFGALSPMLRTHTTKNADSERRIWAYPPEFAEAMRQAFILRYALIPYLYTSARKTFESGTAIVHPLYYDYPEIDEAYAFRDEYLYGDDLLVAPVVAPMDEKSRLAIRSVWIPPGEWIEWQTGARLKGPAKFERRFALDEIPVYMRAGAIIPMQPKMRSTSERPVDPLILTIFPGATGETRVYEDDGATPAYRGSAYAWTPVRDRRLPNGDLEITIGPVEGNYPGMLTKRAYEIHLALDWPPASVTRDGRAVPYASDAPESSWSYDGDSLTTIIHVPETSTRSKVTLVVRPQAALASDAALLDGVPGKIARLRHAMDMLNHTWPKGWSPDILIEAVQTGNRIGLKPENARAELAKLNANMPAILDAIRTMEVDPAAIERVLAHLADLGAPAPPPR